VIPRADARFVFAAHRLPSVVDHRERPIASGRRKFDDVLRIGDDGLRAILAVRPIPIVAAVNRLDGHARIRARLPAKRVNRGERGFIRAARTGNNVADVERA